MFYENTVILSEAKNLMEASKMKLKEVGLIAKEQLKCIKSS